MSQTLHETIDVPNAAFDTARILDDHQHQPQSAQNQDLQGFSNFVDGSGPIFSMYLEMATEEDKKMAEDWKADADGILIFTGLFSAAVASLISVSIQDLQQDPQDTSNFYLANIYRTLADPNGSNVPSSLPTFPPPFSPPNYAVWVNALWFLSLAISLTCALLATFLQRWARRYLKVTHSRYSPPKRARFRTFFAEGVEKCLLPWAVDTLPTLIHISLFLFFAGLVVFLWNVNLTIFKLVLSWVGFCTALYGCITLLPIFRHDSPYYTSLSSPVWRSIMGMAFLISLISGWLLYFTVFCRRGGEWLLEYSFRYWSLFAQGMQKTVEESALQSPPEIDTRAFLWTFESLDEDHELERFFAGLPGFRASKMVKDPLSDITAEQHGRLSETLIGLLDRTFSSDLLPEPVKIRRTVICTKAFHPADIPRASRQVLYGIGSEDQYGPVQSAEIARLVRGWDNGRDEETTVIMQAIVLSVLARAQQRDDLWFTMASNEMGIPESVLRNHAAHGDSLSLAILIHITRKQLSCFMEQYWPWPQFSKNLEAASKFDVLNTSHKLQHEFCALWNQIVRKVQDDGVRLLAYFALQRIRNVYAALHGSTDSAPTHFSVSTGDDDILLEPSSYPLCNIPDHRLDSTPHVHDVPASSTTAHAALHENTAPVPVYPADTPTVPSSSVPATLHVDDSENRKDVPPLDKVQVPFYPTHQTAMESPSIPSTSSDPATTVGATRDIETPAGAMLSTTLATSTFSSFVSPTNAVSFQNTTNILVHSNAPAIPPSASAGLVLDDITEPHCSILTTKSPGTSPRLNSAPEPGSAQCSPSADSSEDKDTSDPLPVTRAIQANTMPPQLQPLLSATDIAIAGPSHRDSDVGKTGGHTPHTSHG